MIVVDMVATVEISDALSVNNRGGISKSLDVGIVLSSDIIFERI